MNWDAIGAVGEILGAVLVIERLLVRRGVDPAVGAEQMFLLYLLTILLITPVSETHHLAFLIPAVVRVTRTSSATDHG